MRLDDAKGVLVATGDGALWLTEVEVEGGGTAADFLEIGARLS